MNKCHRGTENPEMKKLNKKKNKLGELCVSVAKTKKGGRMRIIKILVVTQLIGLTLIYATPPTEAWNKPYDSGENDGARGVAVDNSGNVYVVGSSSDPAGPPYYFRTIKYDPEGTEVWNEAYESGGAQDVAIDNSGYAYVTGSNPSGFFWTIKYRPNGDTIWDRSSDDRYGGARGVAIDNSGYVYVAGGPDFRTIKYTFDGTEVWNKTGGEGYAEAIAVDSSGYIYVTGRSCTGLVTCDFQTIKYTPNGDTVWSRVYNRGPDDKAYGVAVDRSGYVYVAGYTFNGTNNDYLIIKYDGDGTLVGEKPYDSGGNDFAYSIALDRVGCFFVTGESDDDYLTVKFTPIGDVAWKKRYDSGDDDRAYDIAVDEAGYVYVTGFSDYDFRTIKYRQYLILGGQVKDEDGAGMDGVVTHLTGAETRDMTSIGGGYYGFQDLSCGQNYTVTPELSGYSFDPPQRTYTPLGVGLVNEHFTATPLSITVTAPNGGEEWVVASSHSITWTSTGTIANVGLEYSVNSGADWIEIASSTTDDGSYSWTVPNNLSEHCQVKISNVDDPSISDQSDADFTISPATGIEEANSYQPTAYSLQVSSNPFSEKTVIRYTIPDAGYKIPELKIYDVSGRPIRSWDLELGAWDFHQVVWDGTADNGEPVSQGIYFCRLETSGYQAIKKLILLR